MMKRSRCLVSWEKNLVRKFHRAKRSTVEIDGPIIANCLSLCFTQALMVSNYFLGSRCFYLVWASLVDLFKYTSFVKSLIYKNMVIRLSMRSSANKIIPRLWLHSLPFGFYLKHKATLRWMLVISLPVLLSACLGVLHPTNNASLNAFGSEMVLAFNSSSTTTSSPRITTKSDSSLGTRLDNSEPLVWKKSTCF